jgi:CRP-like cAMP-binding protein
MIRSNPETEEKKRPVEGPAPDPSEVRNAILSALPEVELRGPTPHLKKVRLKAGEILHEHGERARGVYFPENGIASETLCGREGRSIELAVVGNEGLMGERAVFGQWGLAEVHCEMFTDSDALMMHPDPFREVFRRGGAFQDLVLSRLEARMIEIAQVALCVQYHSVEQRLSRWLLTLAYRSHSNRFRVTHGHISNMLGVRRSTVSELASGLREAGIVDYSRGNITLLDLAELESGTCECYEVIKNATHAPFGNTGER